VRVTSTGIEFNAALRGKPADTLPSLSPISAGGVKLVCPKLEALRVGHRHGKEAAALRATPDME